MINNKIILIKIFLIIAVICSTQFFSNSSNTVEPDEILENNKQELRARNISKNIRCLVCQNQSIDESNAPLAKDLRILIRNKVKNGKKDDEIYKFTHDFTHIRFQCLRSKSHNVGKNIQVWMD